MTSDGNAHAVAIDAAQLVHQGDLVNAHAVLQASVPHHELQRAALVVMAQILGGDGGTFDELRLATLALAADCGAEDRQVNLSLETIGAAQALAHGDLDRANAITAGSVFAPIDIAWCAVALIGQAVAAWFGDHPTAEFWRGLRQAFGLENAQ